MAQLFNITTDRILNYDGKILKEIVIEDKKTKFIQQLDDEDKQPIFRLIEKMLVNKQFKEFFQNNIIAAL